MPAIPESSSTALPDAWADEAASLPLAFAQVREDPRLDLELAHTLPSDASVAMIASGGETAVCLARLPLRRLHLVDMNAAQLALTKFKCHLAEHTPPAEAAACLGHGQMSEATRERLLASWLGSQGLTDNTFGPPHFVARHGADHSGRYERAFSRLRELLTPHEREWNDLLRLSDSKEAASRLAPETELGQALDTAFAKAFALPNLVRLFGQEATQNPNRPFHEHFACRTRVAIAGHPPASNPFLWQIFAGGFPPEHRYDWLQPPTMPPCQTAAELIYHHGKMSALLEDMPPGSLDLVHLSNILDWLSPSLAEATLRNAAGALRRGGMVVIRQLNSTLDIAAVGSDFVWNHALATQMETRDRSFFYPKLFIGTRS